MNHLIHSCLLALVFYGLYRIFLKGSAGFQWHRVYLLAIPFIAALIPLLVIPMEQTMVAPQFWTVDSMTVAPVILNSSDAAITVAQESIDFGAILLTIYAVGVGISLLAFLYKLARISQYSDDGVTKFEDGCYITTVHDLPTAFSFMNRIYLNDAFAKARYEQILLHEKTHVLQRHSWDLLFYETLRILFWFHPVSYLAQSELKIVHEHIADEKTIAVHGKKSYYENLLREVLDCPDFSFANPFFKSKTIKTRLAMIQKSQNQKFPFRKLLWILPVLFASLTYTACTSELEVIEVNKKTYTVEELPTLQDHVYGQIDFYKGISQKDMIILEQGRELIKQYIGPDTQKEDYYAAFKRMESDPNLADYRKIAKKVSANGKTIVRDVENNNYVLTIHETASGSPSFTGTGPIDQAKMNRDELSAYLKNLHERHGKTENLEIVEEVIEIEEVIPSNSNPVEIVEETSLVPFAIIEKVPTYPGCSGDNAEMKKCMQENITKLVADNFDRSIAGKAGLTGKQTISVQFKIKADGTVGDIISRAKAPELQAEAARVVNLLPKMQPGIQRGKEVGVIYGLPIIFNVTEKEEKQE